MLISKSKYTSNKAKKIDSQIKLSSILTAIDQHLICLFDFIFITKTNLNR
jgi:hypothetical protein